MPKNKHGLNDNWDEVGKSPIWDFSEEKSGAQFFGIFTDKEENVGPNDSNLYNFIRYKDQDFTQRIGEYSIWGTTLLDTRFKNFVRGEQVAIVYLGKRKSEQRKGSEYHDFEVYHRPPEKAVNLEAKELAEEFDGELPM